MNRVLLEFDRPCSYLPTETCKKEPGLRASSESTRGIEVGVVRERWEKGRMIEMVKTWYPKSKMSRRVTGGRWCGAMIEAGREM